MRRASGTIPAAVDTVPVPRVSLRVEHEGDEAGRAQLAGAGREVIVEGQLCRIGSHPTNDLVLRDTGVSSFHCELRATDDGWTVQDGGSLNGTKLEGVRVRDADLPTGSCRITLGNSTVLVRPVDPVALDEIPSQSTFGAVIGSSIGMRRLFGLLERVAVSHCTVLIHGGSGTGKEAIAVEVVRRGPRASRPVVVVDCGAIAPTLIETELFGHARGAFTGAQYDRVGAFEEADGGTVLLDEIGELPLAMQPKLLRVLDTGTIRRVGENRRRRVNVRVIAATNRRLEREVNAGRFRDDLYFRLGVVTVRVPPLRERLDDLPLLIRHFLKQQQAEDSRTLFTPEVLDRMRGYDWPGNVRELRNYVERTVVLDAAGPVRWQLRSTTPPAEANVDLGIGFTDAKQTLVSEFERRYLTALLAWANGNVSRAARHAGMDRMHLHRLLRRHRLPTKR